MRPSRCSAYAHIQTWHRKAYLLKGEKRNSHVRLIFTILSERFWATLASQKMHPPMCVHPGISRGSERLGHPVQIQKKNASTRVGSFKDALLSVDPIHTRTASLESPSNQGFERNAWIIGRIIDKCHILAHELVKAYTRKHVFPRCVIKIDLRKRMILFNGSFYKELKFLLNLSLGLWYVWKR